MHGKRMNIKELILRPSPGTSQAGDEILLCPRAYEQALPMTEQVYPTEFIRAASTIRRLSSPNGRRGEREARATLGMAPPQGLQRQASPKYRIDYTAPSRPTGMKHPAVRLVMAPRTCGPPARSIWATSTPTPPLGSIMSTAKIYHLAPLPRRERCWKSRSRWRRHRADIDFSRIWKFRYCEKDY